MAWKTKVLVVANRTADSDELLEALRKRSSSGGPVAFTLLVPATPQGLAGATDMRSGREAARQQLDAAVTRLRDAGLEVDGVVGDPDPCAAVKDTWDPAEFDEIVVSTLPTHTSKWLQLDLPHRVGRMTGVPVRHVVASEKRTPARQHA